MNAVDGINTRLIEINKKLLAELPVGAIINSAPDEMNHNFRPVLPAFLVYRLFLCGFVPCCVPIPSE